MFHTATKVDIRRLGIYRIGNGFDAHRFENGRKLVLGGVEIPYDKGLAGHSDADVLTHAVMDAILGAIGERDIGSHFPDNDARYLGASSIHLLERVLEMSAVKGYSIQNIDCVIICEEPRISPFVDSIKLSLARALGVSPEDIGIKATSTEGMGFTGRGEGIAVYAVALLWQKGRPQCSAM